MPVDAFAVTALRRELSEALAGGRIDKIHMPAKHEVHIIGRAARGPFRLLLSAHPQRARAHLTTVARENPQTPPMFCMLLRKHLTNSRFAGLTQPRLERVLHFCWDAADEMGAVSRKTVVIEMIGRHSNIILVDAEGRIVDCLRRVDPEMSPQRPVLPGLFYRDPPTQEKEDPMTVKASDFRVLWEKKPLEMSIDTWLEKTFTALPPILCRDIAATASDCDAIYQRIATLSDYVNQNTFTPYFVKDKADFFSLPLFATPQEEYEGSFSAVIDELYTRRDRDEQIGQRAAALLRTAKSSRDKSQKKIGRLRQEHLDAQDRDRLREQADLLMANLHKVVRGAESVTVEDFYHGGGAVTIKLDPAKNPQQNAAALYKAYAKAKNAETAVAAQIEQAERDLEYWDSVHEQLLRVADERDLEEIREEISPGHRQTRGRPTQTHRKKPAAGLQTVSSPMRFRSSDGVIFHAGRNNRQNDLLTMRLASKSDVWLHTQKIPGCHVIIHQRDAGPHGARGAQDVELSDQTLYEAACIAAWFSAARTSPKVPVDYTLVKNVKKPPGAKPGMVTYDRFKTILAEPSEAFVERLRVD